MEITHGQLKELKVAYNRLLARYKKAEIYVDNPKISDEEKEKHMPEFRKLIKAISEAIITFSEMGVTMSDSEVMEGFEKP